MAKKPATVKATPKATPKSKPITKDKAEAGKKAAKDEKWSMSKLAKGDFFSCHQYMKVIKISGRNITLETPEGKKPEIDLGVLVADSYSADHFTQEVSCTMTELAEILQSAGDTILKVEFKKKLDENHIFEKLQAIKAKDINGAGAKDLAKSLIEGAQTTLICHLVKSDNNLGRSLVIDCEAAPGKGWRQVDHRSIQAIIFKNVRYVLGKGKTTFKTFTAPDTKKCKWDEKKLELGNWFSETQYYRFDDKIGAKDTDCTIHNESMDSYNVPMDQLQDMWSATQFASEEKISRSEMVEHLINARESAFTVTFSKKVTAEDVQELLAGVKTDAQLKKDAKTLAT